MIQFSGSPARVCFFLGLALCHLDATDGQASDRAQPCRIEGVQLICAASPQNRKAVFAAMASPESEQMLAQKLDTLPVFSTKLAREQFRMSLEHNWRSALHHARRQTRLYRRGRLGDQSYRRVQRDFKQAEKTYRAAIELYRNHIWRPPGRDG